MIQWIREHLFLFYRGPRFGSQNSCGSLQQCLASSGTGHTYDEYTYIQAKHHIHKIIKKEKSAIVIMIAICLTSLPTGSVPQDCLRNPPLHLVGGHKCLHKRDSESPYGRFSQKLASRSFRVKNSLLYLPFLQPLLLKPPSSHVLFIPT